MGRASTRLLAVAVAVAVAACFLAVWGNAVGASSDVETYCDLAEELFEHLQSTSELEQTMSTDGSDEQREELALAEATTIEYVREMVEVAPVEARAALRMLAENGLANTSIVALESIQASFSAECDFPFLRGVEIRLGLDQIRPAIEAVAAEVGDDARICTVSIVGGSNVSLMADDGSTNLLFTYEDSVLADGDSVDTGFSECASPGDLLAVDIGVLEDFLALHPHTGGAGIWSFTSDPVVDGESVAVTAEPVFVASVPIVGDGKIIQFVLDPETGETIRTEVLD